MYYVRTFKSGAADHDPRQKVWAVYHCSLCGEDSELDITRRLSNFDYGRDRKCPHCNQINAEDKALNLKAQLDKLTAERSRIEIEIDKVVRELDDINTPKDA